MSLKTPKTVFSAIEWECTAADRDVQVPWSGIYE